MVDITVNLNIDYETTNNGILTTAAPKILKQTLVN